MRILLMILAAVCVSACTKSYSLEKDLDAAISELDKQIWEPSVPAKKAEKPKDYKPLK